VLAVRISNGRPPESGRYQQGKRVRPIKAGAVLLLIFCAFAHRADSSEAARNVVQYRTVVVGRLGWSGIEEHAKTDPKTVCSLLTAAQVWLACSEERRTIWVAYEPSEYPQGGELANSLVLATVRMAAGHPVQRRVIEKGILFQAGTGALRLGPLRARFTNVDGKVAFWYIQPFRKVLVRYDVSDGKRREWPLPAALLSHVAPRKGQVYGGLVDFVPESRGSRVWFAFAAESLPRESILTFRGSLRCGSLDLHNIRWSEGHLGPIGSVSGVGLSSNSVFVLSVRLKDYVADRGPLGVLLYQADGVSGLHAAEPSGHLGSAAMAWRPERICSDGGQCLLRLGLRGEPHVIVVRPYSGRIMHICKDDGAWRSEVVWDCSSERFPRRENPGPRIIAPSASFDARGVLHVVFFNPLSHELTHCTREDEAWTSEFVGKAANVVGTDVLVRPNGPLIAFCDAGSREVLLAVPRN